MAVGPDQRVGVVHAVFLVHAARQIFEIDLMHDADAGRHDLERVERLHAPFHELVALIVALELELHVQVECVLRAVIIDHHRVIDDEIDRDERLDQLWILAEILRDVAHRGEVAQQRHAREVLQHDAGDDEGNFVDAFARRFPFGELANVLFGDLLAVAVAEHAFQHDPNRHGQPRNVAEARFFECRQRIQLAGCAGSEAEFLKALEGVVRHGGSIQK